MIVYSYKSSAAVILFLVAYASAKPFEIGDTVKQLQNFGGKALPVVNGMCGALNALQSSYHGHPYMPPQGYPYMTPQGYPQGYTYAYPHESFQGPRQVPPKGSAQGSVQGLPQGSLQGLPQGYPQKFNPGYHPGIGQIQPQKVDHPVEPQINLDKGKQVSKKKDTSHKLQNLFKHNPNGN